MVLSGIEEQVSRANQHKEQQLGLKQQIESEVSWQGSKTDPAPPAWASCPVQRGLDRGWSRQARWAGTVRFWNLPCYPPLLSSWQVANLKKTIKVTTAAAAAATSQDPEQHLTELREPAAGTNQRQPSKKASKGKG